MRKAFGEYRRLARGEFGCSSLWAGERHLLYVKGTGLLLPVVEEYSRLPYRDIEAVSWAPTRTGLIWNLVFVFLLLLGGIPLLAVGLLFLRDGAGDPQAIGAMVVILILTGPIALTGLIGLVINMIFGPTVIFAVQTRAGAVRIRAVRRLGKARQVLAEVADLVAVHHQPSGGAGEPGAAPIPQPAAVPAGAAPPPPETEPEPPPIP